MQIRVKYTDNHFDMVRPETFDRLLEKGAVISFKRQDGWVIPDSDTLRNKSKNGYAGSDRRNRREQQCRGVMFARMAALLCFIALIALVNINTAFAATPPEPFVAIHVSELTQALDTMPAVAPTPTGTGYTGFQWWYTSWHYFVGYESLKETLRSDGTPFVEISDSDIAAGKLRYADGSPRYPILISLASEAIDDNEISPLRDYVSAGGFLIVGSSSFTRNPDGTTRGDFALANEIGVSMANPTLLNTYENKHFTKYIDDWLVSHFPAGQLILRYPLTFDEIPIMSVSPLTIHNAHYAWQVVPNGATVLANGDSGPLVTLKKYGLGQIVYHGAFQPLLGHGGYDPSMFAYLIYRKAIEQAFLSFNVPTVRLSSWRYPYDAALLVRHDFENIIDLIKSIEASAQYEKSAGVAGEYYFSTGALRTYTGDDKTAIVSSLKNAVSSFGATIGSHNGGLPNPVDLSLLPTDYSYWHWGPDEALDQNPPGYANGKSYAKASILASFQDIEGWLAGLDNGRVGCGEAGNCPRVWVSPAFNSTREASMEILHELGSVSMGEQKVGPFPHWTLSYSNPVTHYSHLSLPLSEWYGSTDIIQSLDGHSSGTMRAGVDLYYDLGALINFYGHAPSNNGNVQQDYISYSMTKPKLWPTNAVAVYDWWKLRSAVHVTPLFSATGNSYTVTVTVSGATDPETSIEINVPTFYSGTKNIFLNGVLAKPSEYRISTNALSSLKVRVGSTVKTVVVQNWSNMPPVAVNDAYSTTKNIKLSIMVPGVLSNDADLEGAALTAQKVSGPAHGTLTLNSNGSFSYTPTTGYIGADSFTYKASDGVLTSNTATVAITVAAVNQAPVATNDSYSTNQNTVLNQAAPGVLANDTDPEGAILTAQKVSGPAHGTLTLNSNGSFTYTPTTGYIGADSFTYKASDGTLTSNTATVAITVAAVNQAPVATNDSYSTNQNTALNQAAPGVLANDTDSEGTALTAQLVIGPSNGTLTLSSNGSFMYTPATGYSGTDSFTYKASDGVLASTTATVSITVVPASIFSDNFTLTVAPPDPSSPWTSQMGTWSVAGGTLQGLGSSVAYYGYAYVAPTPLWTNYSVEGRVQFPAGSFGGGLGGRVNPTTGARYGLWVYPDASVGGSNVLKLVKFRDWTTWSGIPAGQVSLPSVGTGWHNLKMVFNGSLIQVYYDGAMMMEGSDGGFDGRAAYLTGGISVDLGTLPGYSGGYTMAVDDVLVSALP